MTERGGYERADAPPRLVVAAIAGCLSLIGVGALTAWAVLAGFRSQAPPLVATGFDRVAAVPATPKLETDQRADRLALQRRAEAHLAGYGWTDQAAGIARIPIDRAMALQAARGWPDADSSRAGAARPSTAATR